MSGPTPDDPSTGHGPRADAIVVAAGRSTRMGGIDKVLAPVAGRPLLAWTLEGLAAVPAIERIVLVIGSDRVAELRAMPWLPPNVVAVVAGGDIRQVSVAAGFAALEALDGVDPPGRDLAGERVLLVQDGARPVVDRTMVEAVIAATHGYGAALPVVPITETVKRLDGELVGETVDRDGLGVAQTPQGVRRALLREAYARFPPAGEPTFTDEAGLLEACRIAVHVVPGDPSNLKVTRPSDLRRVEVALAGPAPSGARAARVGIGQDQHPFGPGSPLALGGIVVDGAPALHGHSDGDVALHAVCDALLGAAGLGDLGRLFPADPSTPEGIASGVMLDEVVQRVTAAGWGVSNLDVTIVAARPRLAAHLDAMRTAIADRLRVPTDAVNVKASTGNLIGDDGAGRSISATAIVLLEAAS